ncbi:MAG: cbb3-type cytochrome c oxidase subunit I [Gemmatimonas sp.]
MTALVRRYLKTAIFFLIVGLALGAWAMVQRELGRTFPGTFLISAHTHAILVGFVMLMILGVAQWMFPRPSKSDTQYSAKRAAVAYWLVTLGTAARVFGELLRSGNSALWLRWTILLSGFAQIAGLSLFFYNMWSRIRAVGSELREKSGEQF